MYHVTEKIFPFTIAEYIDNLALRAPRGDNLSNCRLIENEITILVQEQPFLDMSRTLDVTNCQFCLVTDVNGSQLFRTKNIQQR